MRVVGVRRGFRTFLVILLGLAILSPAAYADLYAFSPDSQKVKDAFEGEYCWDEGKINAPEWTGQDGLTPFRRAAGHQREYYDDLYEWSRKFCLENNLISVSSGSIGSRFGGATIAAVARAEVDAPDSSEVPPGSNHVKYNQWFYGSDTAAPWCAIFVSWCAEQCGLIDSGLFRKDAGVTTTFSYMTKDNGFDSYTWSETKQLGGGGYEVVPGDLFFFEGMGHIGIVTAATDSSIEVTHGNSSEDDVMASLMSPDGYMSRGTIVHVEYPNAVAGGYASEYAAGDIGAIFYFLTSYMGLNTAAACGILANIEHESGFNVHAVGDGGDAYGLCQWNSRNWELRAFCASNGYDYTTMEGQLYFLEYELNTGYSSVYSYLRSVPDSGEGAYDAAYYFCVNFEIPQDKETKGYNRGSTARDSYYPMYC